MNLFLQISLLLEQTAQEKKLTILYVALFILAIGMLVIDSITMNKYGTKGSKILLFLILIVAIIALLLLIFTNYNK